jgi:hypothetical protein
MLHDQIVKTFFWSPFPKMREMICKGPAPPLPVYLLRQIASSRLFISIRRYAYLEMLFLNLKDSTLCRFVDFMQPRKSKGFQIHWLATDLAQLPSETETQNLCVAWTLHH